jgi:hypothetical protein
MDKKFKRNKGLESTFLQRTYTNEQQGHENMLNTTIDQKRNLKTTVRCQLIHARVALINKDK